MAQTLELTETRDGAAGDYLRLMKPRVMSLVIFTALVGLLMAEAPPHPVVAVSAVLLIAAGAGASAALNMWYDADIDALMARTKMRPVPSGRIAPESALEFGLWLGGLSVLSMAVMINYVSAALLAFTIFFYVGVYTMWLKRRTPQNIVIGGAAGALPPVIGWTAATGALSFEPLVYFAIIFLWTPPHFWALALLCQADYRAAKIPMLPNVVGARGTVRHIVFYMVLLAVATMLPYLLGFVGAFYFFGALALNIALIGLGVALLLLPNKQDALARAIFAYSIAYLFLIFCLLPTDRFLMG